MLPKGLKRLRFVEGTVNKERYCTLLLEELIPSIDQEAVSYWKFYFSIRLCFLSQRKISKSLDRKYNGSELFIK